MKVEVKIAPGAWGGDRARLEQLIAEKVEQALRDVPGDRTIPRYPMMTAIGANEPAEAVAARVASELAATFRKTAAQTKEHDDRVAFESQVPVAQSLDAIVDKQTRTIREDGFARECERIRAAIAHLDVYAKQRHMNLWWNSFNNPRVRAAFDSSYFDALNTSAAKDSDGSYMTFNFRGKTVNLGNMNYYFLGMMYRGGGFSKGFTHAEIKLWKFGGGTPIEFEMADKGFDEYGHPPKQISGGRQMGTREAKALGLQPGPAIG